MKNNNKATEVDLNKDANNWWSKINKRHQLDIEYETFGCIEINSDKNQIDSDILFMYKNK
jgi:hypothetical protein